MRRTAAHWRYGHLGLSGQAGIEDNEGEGGRHGHQRHDRASFEPLTRGRGWGENKRPEDGQHIFRLNFQGDFPPRNHFQFFGRAEIPPPPSRPDPHPCEGGDDCSGGSVRILPDIPQVIDHQQKPGPDVGDEVAEERHEAEHRRALHPWERGVGCGGGVRSCGCVCKAYQCERAIHVPLRGGGVILYHVLLRSLPNVMVRQGNWGLGIRPFFDDLLNDQKMALAAKSKPSVLKKK